MWHAFIIHYLKVFNMTHKLNVGVNVQQAICLSRTWESIAQCFQKPEKDFAINKAQLAMHFLIIEHIQIQLAKMLLNLFKAKLKLNPQFKTLNFHNNWSR